MKVTHPGVTISLLSLSLSSAALAQRDPSAPPAAPSATSTASDAEAAQAPTGSALPVTPPPIASPPSSPANGEPAVARAPRPAISVQTQPLAPPRRRAGVKDHDGLYLRLGTGFGAYTERLSSDEQTPRTDDLQARSAGFAVMTEFAVGGTIARGFVLGGGVYNADVLASRLSVENDSSVPDELDAASRNFTIIGPFGDWYFDPHEGFHAQAALGFAQLHGIDVSGGNVDEHRYHASGVGLMLGAGYEWWVGEQWSLGILGRLMAAAVVGQDDQDLDWFHGISSFPSVLLSITYH